MLVFSRASLLRCSGCRNPAEMDGSYFRTRIKSAATFWNGRDGIDCSSLVLSASPTGVPGISSNLRYGVEDLEDSGLLAEIILGQNFVHPNAVFQVVAR